MILPASDEIHDLDLSALANHARGVRVALEHDQIEFDRDAAWVDPQAGEEFGDGEGARHVVRLTVERDSHTIERTPGFSRGRFERLFDGPLLGWYREVILPRRNPRLSSDMSGISSAHQSLGIAGFTFADLHQPARLGASV